MKILENGAAVIEGDSHHARWIEQEGLVHDLFTANIIREVIREHNVKVAVDAGANIGTLTRVMIDAGLSMIHAFEPNPDAIECLRYNCPEARVYECGLGDRCRKMMIVQCENAGASFVRSVSDQLDFPTIQLQPLDLFAIEPQFIKLDCEGFEVYALQGAKQIIERYKPVILCEINPSALERACCSENQVYQMLNAHGYEFSIIQPDCKFGDPQFDILAIPK